MPDGMPVEEKTLVSQLSQSSLFSESEVAIETEIPDQVLLDDSNSSSILTETIIKSDDENISGENLKETQKCYEGSNEANNKINNYENKIKDDEKIEEGNLLVENEKLKVGSVECDISDYSADPDEGKHSFIPG